MSHTEKTQFINEFFGKYEQKLKYNNFKITQAEVIYNLLKTGEIIETDDPVVLNYYGFYFLFKEKNYDEVKRYYLMAIEKGSVYAIYNLGNYYRNIEKNYEEMKRYYLMAIEKGDSDAMCNLGCYYDNEKNYEEMKLYYLMAIEKGHPTAMCNLGYYYNKVEKNYEEMKRYYLMAIEKGNVTAMCNLGSYYQVTEINYDKMKRYYLMAIEKDSVKAMCNLGAYYQVTEINHERMKHYFLLALEKGNHTTAHNLQGYIIQTRDFAFLLDEYKKGNDLSRFIPSFAAVIRKYELSKKYGITDTCGICLEENKICILTGCYHPFCLDCTVDCLAKNYDKCPTCRSALS